MTRTQSSPDPLRCLFVIGMHRSGTSAVTEVLAGMGLTTPSVGDVIGATRSNPHGHWESKRLVAFDHRLLATLGATWQAPPDLAVGWEKAPSLDELRSEAPTLFGSTFSSAPGSSAPGSSAPGSSAPGVAFKDPRLCVLLPFWRSVLELPKAAVFVFRDPLEVARSLEARDGVPKVHGLALWERYVRSACKNLEGLPTFAVDYGRIVENPAEVSEDLGTFVGELGIRARSAAESTASTFDPGLRHHRDRGVRNAQAASADCVMSRLRAVQGAHDAWRCPELEPEPEWVTDVISMRSELDESRRSQRIYEISRAHRLVSWLQRRVRR